MTAMPHLILLGDSIFDNAAYVGGGPAVIDQVRQSLPAGWQATLLAVDGDTTAEVPQQLQRLPIDATYLVLSVGGNDALACLPQIEGPASSVKQGLVTLHRIKTSFEVSYGTLIKTLLTLNKPLMVCTIYDAIPGLPPELITALSVFNDVILREAIQHCLPVLDLRMICTEPGDYSALSPIEPSSLGGAKLASQLVLGVMSHDFGGRDCYVVGNAVRSGSVTGALKSERTAG
jgi:hypothetical protein